MIGHIIEQKTGKRIVLLKAGSVYLCQEITDYPVLIRNCIDQISTTQGNMYLGPNLFFGPIVQTDPIAIAEDPENLTLALLASVEIAHFLQKIIQEWSTGNAPTWALESTDDLLNYMRWNHWRG
jgi:hypothetical protein